MSMVLVNILVNKRGRDYMIIKIDVVKLRKKSVIYIYIMFKKKGI